MEFMLIVLAIAGALYVLAIVLVVVLLVRAIVTDRPTRQPDPVVEAERIVRHAYVSARRQARHTSRVWT